MEYMLSITISILYGAGIYLILRRSMVKLIIGLILLGNAVNLLIFLFGRLKKGLPPIIGDKSENMTEAFADPLAQALILTAIVISFGLQSFAIILIKRVFKVVKTDDLDEINTKTYS